MLLDVQLPDFDGFEVARRLTDAGLDTAAVLISTRDRAPRFDGAWRRAPVRGFIPKSELSAEALAELVG